MDCGKKIGNSEVADLFGGAIYPHDLMEIAASMQGLGVGQDVSTVHKLLGICL